MDKLIFLGTGSAANLERQMTGLCFVGRDRAFLVDAGDGMGTVRQLVAAQVDLASVNDIFVTHCHADHVLGISRLLFIKLLREKDAHVRIYGPRQALQTVQKVTFLTSDFVYERRERLSFLPLASGESVQLVPGVAITGVRVKGPQDNPIVCYGYIINIYKQRVAFTGDMQPQDRFAMYARDTRILVHECFGTVDQEGFIHRVGHSTAKDAGQLAAQIKAKTLILTHLNLDAAGHDGAALIAEAKQYFSGTIILAQDRMEVSLS